MRRLAFLLLPLAVSACLQSASPTGRGAASGDLLILTADGDVTLSVEIADTADERAKGLMDRESLPTGAGMAFLWDRPTESTFWMKDTVIPLSIAFWDEGGQIVGILDMAPCEADPCPSYASPEPYIGAIETEQGWFTEQGVAVGDRVELSTAGA